MAWTAPHPIQTVYSPTKACPSKSGSHARPAAKNSTTRRSLRPTTRWGDPRVTAMPMATFDDDLRPLGRPVTTSDGKGTQTRSYDPTSGLLVQTRRLCRRYFTAAYDADGNMVAQGLPNGLAAKTTYDETGAPATSPTRRSRTARSNAPGSTSTPNARSSARFSPRKACPQASSTSYDKAGRLTLVKDTPTGGACTTRSYSYDADSNRTALVTRAPGIGGACDIKSSGTPQTYQYDKGIASSAKASPTTISVASPACPANTQAEGR